MSDKADKLIARNHPAQHSPTLDQHQHNPIIAQAYAGSEWCSIKSAGEVVVPPIPIDYGEQCADTDGMAKYLVSDGHEAPFPGISGPPNPSAVIDELQARIARKEAANEALVARVFASERKAADWEAECRRLAAVLVEKEWALAQLMAIPANALKHGR